MKAPKEIRATKVSDKGKDENEDESEKGKEIKRIKNNQKYFANQTKKKKKAAPFCWLMEEPKNVILIFFC